MNYTDRSYTTQQEREERLEAIRLYATLPNDMLVGFAKGFVDGIEFAAQHVECQRFGISKALREEKDRVDTIT